MLRLENLFERLEFFAGRDHPFDHHVAITTLFELLEASGRADLKSDLLQELDRQRLSLAQFIDRPDVDQAALDGILAQINETHARLATQTGKSGQHVRDNEWLMSVRSRTAIAGGACQFDLPSYFAWQHRPLEKRRQDLVEWEAPFLPIRDSLAIVLRLLRDSAQRARLTARPGAGYQQPLGGRTHQMIQVRLDPDTGAIPEISANKHLLWIRFITQGGDLKPRPFESTVEFELALCNL